MWNQELLKQIESVKFYSLNKKLIFSSRPKRASPEAANKGEKRAFEATKLIAWLIKEAAAERSK